MTHEVVSVICSGSNLTSHIDRIIDNTGNYFAPCVAYEKLLRTSTPDIIIYIHDDVTIHDSNWLERVIDCFDVPMYPSENTVAVGLGGATQLGNGNLYRKPYNIMNMARYGYAIVAGAGCGANLRIGHGGAHRGCGHRLPPCLFGIRAVMARTPRWKPWPCRPASGR